MPDYVPLTQLGRRRPSSTPAALISESEVSWPPTPAPNPTTLQTTNPPPRLQTPGHPPTPPAPSEGDLARQQTSSDPYRPLTTKLAAFTAAAHAVNERDIIKPRQQIRALLGRRSRLGFRPRFAQGAAPAGSQRGEPGSEKGGREEERWETSGSDDASVVPLLAR